MNQNTFNLIYNIANNKEKMHNIKTLLNTNSSVLTKNSTIKNSQDLGYKLIFTNRNYIKIEKEILIKNTFELFSQYNETYTNDELSELKDELLNIDFEKSHPLIFKLEDIYFDLSIYHILHFIKDTKYILNNLNSKKRTYHSRFKIDVLQKQLKALEEISSNQFFQPKKEYDIKVLNSKKKLLNIFTENYNIVFAYAHLYSFLPMQNIANKIHLEETYQDFIKFVNIISVEKREILKSFAILIYKTYQNILPNSVIELFTQNILRIFFEKEILEINKNKLNDFYEDTFLIDSKIYSKNPYIHSTFDNIPIYSINKQNKYFFYKGLNQKEFMKSYIYLLKRYGINKISLSMYKYFLKQFKNPTKHSFQKQYPEFFEKQNINMLNIQHTFFSEMKKYAPDNLK